MQVTRNLIEGNNLPLKRQELITEEQGNAVSNTDFNLQGRDEEDVENPEDSNNVANLNKLSKKKIVRKQE